ncbi:MAG: CocE/NonD family hydrolase [Clostridia bacterium]|nr:CocE/NonD family hydrolase [Clostridia bacterium]
MAPVAYYETISYAGATFFTVVLLPCADRQFPTVILRSPYVNDMKDSPEEEIVQNYLRGYGAWLDRGYAVVFQHCRGQGKSTGAFVPYIHEHEDGRLLRAWIRQQPFYNGELFLFGGSYTASLHYTTAPFEEDIRGAVLEVQDAERYRLWYRNGQMRKGHANWHFDLYKPKCGLTKTHTMASFSQLPLQGLSQRVLGEYAEDFEQMLTAERPDDPFWNTRNGGGEAHGVTDDIPFPVLFTTGYNDFYVGGMFAMWNRMSPRAKAACAMLVSPYDHGDGYHPELGLAFPDGQRAAHFGPHYPIDWMDHIRKGTALPYETGVITYYRLFENTWQSDFHRVPTAEKWVPLGDDTISFRYTPAQPPRFSPEGMFQPAFAGREDVVTLYTAPFDTALFIKGKMQATLTVSSNRPDTAFYISISIEKPQGDYRLRHDITSLGYQVGDYTENTVVSLAFTFDETAFLLKKGERLRIDIASADDGTYVNHTNHAGPYSLQTDAVPAENRVLLAQSRLVLPVES